MDRDTFRDLRAASAASTVQPTAPETKPTNPKDAIGSDKLPVHLWPTTATLTGSLALLDGALKYGRSNFREIGVRSTIYYDAAMRHLMAWLEGEDNDPDSGVPHLGHALACLAIIIDAQAAGKLNDDRAIKGGYRDLVEDLTPHVKRLKALHAQRTPYHYTIQDNKP
jgi:hypothetical protein